MKCRSDVREYINHLIYDIMCAGFNTPENFEQERENWSKMIELKTFLGDHNLSCFKYHLANKIKSTEYGIVRSLYCDIFDYAFEKEKKARYVELEDDGEEAVVVRG